MSTTTIARETGQDRVVIAREAGYKRLSFISIVAGVFVAYGAFAVVVAIAAAVLDATNVTTIEEYDWETVGTAGGIVMAVSLFLAYLFGGYAAGRMARRAGLGHGLGVFFLGILVAVGIGFAVNAATDTATIADNLRSVGIPTSRSEWESVGTIAGLASLVGILLGSVLGGVLGDRWHTKLTARAADPERGPDRVVDVRDRDRDGDVDRDDEVVEHSWTAADRDDQIDPDNVVIERDNVVVDRDRPVVTGRGDTQVITRDADADNLPDESRSGRAF